MNILLWHLHSFIHRSFFGKISKKEHKQTNKREQDSSAEMSFKYLSHWITRLEKYIIKSTSRFSRQCADEVSERSQYKRSTGNQVSTSCNEQELKAYVFHQQSKYRTQCLLAFLHFWAAELENWFTSV